ncbi:hypothetical protein F5883DRAFT_261631 [Diaporthe sp. PMI_573]|nr:hypothetical protein F5883DRAFT_261631 [Diaporthaceae sp. PMI_573]
MTSLGWENWRNFQRAGAMLGHTGLRDFQGLRATGAGPNCRRRLQNGACKSARCAASKVYHLREPAHLRASSLEAGRSGILGTTWSCAACGLWLKNRAWDNEPKRWACGGGRVCPGPPGTRCFDLTWAGWGCECSGGTSGTRSVSESLASSLD